jgi:hypothetical protein
MPSFSFLTPLLKDVLSLKLFFILRRVSMKAFGLILVSGLLLLSFRVNAQSGSATQQNGSTISAKTHLSKASMLLQP